MIMQDYYSTAAASLLRLDPVNVSDPRNAEDILVAHLIYKCVVKIAGWVWPRIKGTDPVAPRLEPWVCEMTSLLISIIEL
jgi:hypothetical protein